MLANARTLTQIIEAQALVARDELAALDKQVKDVETDLAAVDAEIADLHARSDHRRSLRVRQERDAFRLAALPPSALPRDLSDAQIEALLELRALETALLSAHNKLTERADTLARLKDAVAVKHAQLARLRERARVLSAAAAAGDTAVREAQLAVLKGLAHEAAASQTALAQLVASAMVLEGDAGSWSMPVRGVITQAFGPSALPYSPPRTFGGVTFPHFHDAIDIAAPLGTPVAAAADGHVTFVGHLPDGAMIVLIAHPGGFVSQYAHLDDTFARPPVKVAQNVKAGEVVGFIGLTGMTTGPHLHFSVLRAGEPIDPLALIGGRSPS